MCHHEEQFCLDKLLAGHTWLLPLQCVALVSCSCLTQQMGAAFRESSVLFLMVEKKKCGVMTTISFNELVICMYELVKRTCSLRHERFIFTVSKSINYSGSANCYVILSHAPTTENKQGLNTVWKQHLTSLHMLQDWHDEDCILTQIWVNWNFENLINLHFYFCLKVQKNWVVVCVHVKRFYKICCYCAAFFSAPCVVNGWQAKSYKLNLDFVFHDSWGRAIWVFSG